MLPISKLSLMLTPRDITIRGRSGEQVIESLRAGRNQVLLRPTLSFTDDETDLEKKRPTKD